MLNCNEKESNIPQLAISLRVNLQQFRVHSYWLNLPVPDSGPCLTSELSRELHERRPSTSIPKAQNIAEYVRGWSIRIIVKRLDGASGPDERDLIRSDVVGPRSNPDGGVWIWKGFSRRESFFCHGSEALPALFRFGIYTRG
jgi:hypothetical protein